MNLYAKDLIIYSKLEIPILNDSLIRRENLEKILDQSLNKKLTYITSPSGFGKTTLLSQWSKNIDVDLAWISLDENDNNIHQFFRYLIISIQRSTNLNFGKELIEELNSNLINIDRIIILFLNEFIIYPTKYNIIIDNYNEITNEDIRRALNKIINYIPNNVSIIISSKKKDTLIDISKLRSFNQLLELNTEDIKFNSKDLESFFKIKGFKLDNNQLKKIEEKTEGWALSLQLMSFFMKENKDIDFEKDFENIYIFDFVFEKILEGLDEKYLDFLLKTSFLSYFNDEITSKIENIEFSHEIIKYLNHNNLFVIRVDNSGEWFRYNKLFSDLLKKKFRQIYSKKEEKKIRELAYKWYLERKMFVQSLEQLLALKQEDTILEVINNIIESNEYNLRHSYLEYIDKSNFESICKYPRLLFFYVQKLVYDFNFEKAEIIISFIEKKLKPIPNEIKNYILFFNGYKLYLENNVTKSLEKIESCLKESIEENDTFMISNCYIALSSLYLRKSMFNEALIIMNKGLELHKKNESLELETISDMIFILITLNKLSEAEKKYNYVLEKIEKVSYSYNYQSIKTKLLIARITLDFYYNKDISDDVKELDIFISKIDNISLVHYAYSSLANIMISKLKFDEASILIDKLEEFNNESLSIETTFIKIRYFLFKKELVLAKYHFESLNLTIDIDSNLDLFFTTLNLYISLNNLDLSQNLLDKFFEYHDNKESIYYIYALIFKSIISYKKNKEDESSEIFLQAIKLIVKSKSLSILCEFSNDIREIINKILSDLNKKIRHSIVPYIDLSFFDELLITSYKNTNKEISENLDLNISFTKREIELLDLLESRISNTEMSNQLFISVNTLKTHIKNIYKKLKVNDREEALIKYKAIISAKK